MLIDWFTVIAQGINFLILAWLLKRFLYGPIMKTMQKRQQRLAYEQAETRAMREKATHKAQELSMKRDELEKEAASILAEARSHAEQQRDQWLAEAKVEVEVRTNQWMEAVDRERSDVSEKLRIRIAEQVIHLTEKALRDLAGEELETLALEGFIKRLPDFTQNTTTHGPLSIRTGFPLTKESAARLKGHISKRLPDCGEINAISDPDLGFGIVMIVGDTKWEWNLASYLDEVEKAVFEELPQTKAAT